jgi:amidase
MYRSALELAALVRAGELSAVELVTACLERIEAVQPVVNAFTFVAAESALAAAADVAAGDPRPFAGVPIAVKDNRAVAAMPMTCCSSLYGDFVPSEDAFVVRRLRDAGFVIVGKTSMPEMGILPTCEPRRFGPCLNPWSLEVTPGGSSGGSAAAVAAGMVPIAHGNDGGGSTRIPASCCGLVGLKPARGRISSGPSSGQSFLACDGVLTRTVGETAAVLDVLAGYEPGDANWAPPVDGSFVPARDPGFARLRIGLALNPPLDGAGLSPSYATAARDACALLESLGHCVEEITPPWSGLDLLPDFTRAFGPLISMGTYGGSVASGREVTEELVEPLTWAMWQRTLSQTTLAHLKAQSRLETVSRSVISFLSAYDAVVTPALARSPLPLGSVHGRGPDPLDHYRRSGAFTPFTAIVNVMGLPAVALPLYLDSRGLPLAVQLIGRPAGEAALLALSAEIEAALPWASRRAPDRARAA